MLLYSDGIIFKFRFQKSRFIEEIGKSSGYFFVGLYLSLGCSRVGFNFLFCFMKRTYLRGFE